jgi:hypothetical protein
MHVAEDSQMLREIEETMHAVLFEGASFALGLGIAYLAVCYGIPMPTPEKMQESNP